MGTLRKYPPKGRLQAATILETMVALSILLVIFGIAVTLFIRVGAESMSLKKLEAAPLLKDFSEDTRRQGEFVDGERRIDGFTLKRRVTEMNDIPGLWRIHYYIYDRDDHLLQDWQQFVLQTEPPLKQ